MRTDGDDLWNGETRDGDGRSDLLLQLWRLVLALKLELKVNVSKEVTSNFDLGSGVWTSSRARGEVTLLDLASDLKEKSVLKPLCEQQKGETNVRQDLARVFDQ